MINYANFIKAEHLNDFLDFEKLVFEEDFEYDDKFDKFMPVESSDNIWYCWNNGYVDTDIFNDVFDALDEADQIRFVESWIKHFEQGW